MKVIETPTQSEEALKSLNEPAYDGLVRRGHDEYEACFLAFHPFLKVKAGHEEQASLIHKGNWPQAKKIEEWFEPFSWTDFLKISGITSYKHLDQVLAFYHCAYRYGNKIEYKKLRLTLNNHQEIVVPFVDELPEILAFNILRYLKRQGYLQVYIYSDIEDKSKLLDIDSLIEGSVELPSHVRIETSDSKIIIAQNFDQRFSFFFSTKAVLDDIIKDVDLEGFFCNENTMGCWSYEIIPENMRIDWSEFRSIDE